MLDAYYLSLKEETPNKDYWDYAFLSDYLEGRMWNTGVKFDTHEVMELPHQDRAVVVIPARHHADKANEINEQLEHIDKVVLFLMGDEEADFPVKQIVHPDIDIWVQNPHPHIHDDYNRIGTGYSPHTRLLDDVDFEKDIDVFFSGQITHNRRKDMNDQMLEFEAHHDNVIYEATRGFTQGMKPEDYIYHMERAKIAPAPSGAVIPDSFRLYEALESMAIPLADEVNPSGTITEYWDWLFGEPAPFPHVLRWSELGELIRTNLENYTPNVNKQTAWWIKYKRDFAWKVTNQIKE